MRVNSQLWLQKSLTNNYIYMTPKEFFYAVANMRAAQKAYFKTRSQSNLRAARAAERSIDEEITRVKNVLYDLEHNNKEQ